MSDVSLAFNLVYLIFVSLKYISIYFSMIGAEDSVVVKFDFFFFIYYDTKSAWKDNNKKSKVSSN